MTDTTPRRRAGLAALLLAGTALGGLAFWHGADAQPAPAAITPPAITQPAMPMAGFADLVARVRPAVVTITASDRATPAAEAPRGRPGQARAALGSGFLVDASGHVVTNNHVVQGAATLKVKLDDGREFTARIIGRDPRTDLALLKIEAGSALPHLTLGDSDRARPGDWVVAVGNPFGLGGTVTAGIVSARSRDIGAGPYDDFLQIDAPINSGNSGGPLFATDGSVIGVNTAIFSPSGGSVGIGFAIPSNMVRQVVTQLQANGRMERGFLGASTQPVTPALAQALRLAKPEGALVGQVEAESPAARAGLRAGDVVTAVDATPVTNPRDLARAIGDARPGSTVKLAVQRDGAAQDIAITLATLPGEEGARSADAAETRGGPVGVALAPVTEETRRSLNLGPDAKGAVIADVRPHSPAAEAGLRRGDVILGVAGRDVADVPQAVAAIREAVRSPGAALALRIQREGRSVFVGVQMPTAQG